MVWIRKDINMYISYTPLGNTGEWVTVTRLPGAGTWVTSGIWKNGRKLRKPQIFDSMWDALSCMEDWAL